MATERAEPGLAEIREACARWESRAKGPVDEATVRGAIVGLYEHGDLPPPALIEITHSPRAIAAVAHLRRDRLDPEGRDRLDLTTSLWRHAFAVADELVGEVERSLRVELAPPAADRLLRWADPSIARAFPSPGTEYAPCRPDLRARFVRTEAALPFVVAKELRGQELRPFEAVLEACEYLCLGTRRAIVSLHPPLQSVDTLGRFHRLDGPAVRWLDGTQLWCWHGLEIDRRAFEGPELLRVDDVAREERPGPRQWLLERYGLGRFLRDVGAPSIGRDEAGELFRCELAGAEPIVALRVEDRVREADGTPKVHWLRVPPGLRSPRAAAAWTFGVETARYRPTVET